MTPHIHPVQIYYEDTDFTGVVYHANYLKYFERAREHLLGVDVLVKLFEDTGIGFVVYKADLTFKEGAEHGDRLEVRTTCTLESGYRCIFDQRIYREGSDALMVQGEVHLVCVDKDRKLVALPSVVVDGIRAKFPA